MDSDDWFEREDVFLNHVKQACLEESNKVLVSPTMKVRKLANKIDHDYVYLVINIPDHQSSETQGPQDDLGVFEAEDIQNVLYQMNYEIEYIPWGVRLILLHSMEFELTQIGRAHV